MLERVRASAIRKQRAMPRVAIVVSLQCASTRVTGRADPGLPLSAVTAGALPGPLVDPRTAPQEAWLVRRRVRFDRARAPPACSGRGPSRPRHLPSRHTAERDPP